MREALNFPPTHDQDDCPSIAANVFFVRATARGGTMRTPSDFLQAIIDDQVPLAGSELAEGNLLRLIEMTRDAHPVNRDWATFLLAYEEVDTPDVRNALLAAAEDESDFVRAEAIRGLAQRDKILALPLLRRELARTSVALPIFEAATIVADASLVDQLREFVTPCGNLDGAAREALTACEPD